MNCPQCGSSLGEGAKGCVCGWKASRSNVWLILGIVAGVLVLVCGGCAVAAWVFGSRAFKEIQSRGTPIVLMTYRIQAVQYAKKHGKLPEKLQDAMTEPVEADPGQDEGIEEFRKSLRTEGQKAADTWGHEVRYTRKDDSSFEIRSGGPDGIMDNADDVVQQGRAGEDTAPLKKELERMIKEIGRAIVGGKEEKK